jgi:hypothetical protein
MNNNEDCGIAGPQQKYMPIDTINNPILENFCKIHHIPLDFNNLGFFAGTMFIAKTSMLNKFFKTYNISVRDLYINMEEGYSKNHQPTFTHSCERILSGIIPQCLGFTKLFLT